MADPRISPLPDEQWDDGVRQALSPLLPTERANPRDAGSLLATLLRHRSLTEAYLHFNAHLLLHSTLSPRVREVAILRAAVHRQCDYLWDHHVSLALRAGLTDAEVAVIRSGGGALLGDEDLLVVAAADELDARSTLSDVTWSALSEHFTEPQRMDLVFTVGAYHLLAMAVNAFGLVDDR
jgi:4-carboxymuconolactone decarboxylase